MRSGILLLVLVLTAPICRAQNGGARNDDGLPAPSIGAGPRSGGHAIGHGGVQPVDRIEGADRTRVDDAIRALDHLRARGPRVLSEAELAATLTERAVPSMTLSRGSGTLPADLPNFERAARQVNDWVRSGEDLTQEKIVEINRLLLSGSHDDWAGVLRSLSGITVYIGDTGHEFAKPETVDAHLADFLEWYRSTETMHPVERAAKAYQQLLRIHPFRDANGRTTRLVMDFILQRGGFLPAVFDSQAQAFVIKVATADVVINVAKAVERSRSVLDTKVPARSGADLARDRAVARVRGIDARLGELGRLDRERVR